jgi:hypothetical protein
MTHAGERDYPVSRTAYRRHLIPFRREKLARRCVAQEVASAAGWTDEKVLPRLARVRGGRQKMASLSALTGRKRIAVIGGFRSGTNYLRFLLENNYRCDVSFHAFGWKHANVPIISDQFLMKYQKYSMI